MTKLYEQYHLSIERNADDFFLSQTDHSGDDHGIALHLSQIWTLAKAAGLLATPLAPDGRPTAVQQTLEDSDEMHHLQIDVDEEGTIHLYQTQVHGMGGSDEHVMLHPTQAAWLGARLLALSCLAKPLPSPLEGPSIEPPVNTRAGSAKASGSE